MWFTLWVIFNQYELDISLHLNVITDQNFNNKISKK